MTQGSCLCGAVKFRLTAPPETMGTCHCSRCRKAGASTIVFVKKDTIQWLQGRDNVATYKPEAPFKYGRCFCKTCGTSLGEILADLDSVPIAANVFDAELGITNQFHEHVEDRPAWAVESDPAG